jgi:hypothetical protein
MLVLLGALNIGAHAAARAGAVARDAAGVPSGRGPLRSFSVGLVHGLAGSAAIALLVLSTIHASAWAFAYLLLFAFGTVLAMTALTCTLAFPLAAVATRFGAVERHLTRLSGAASIAFGLVIAYRVGFVHHLLAFAP